MNKAASASDQVEYSQAGNPEKYMEKKKAKSGRQYVVAKGVTCQGITSKT